MEYAKNVTETNAQKAMPRCRQTGPTSIKTGAERGAGNKDRQKRTRAYELAFSTVTARRFCDQQEMSLQTATGRSLP